MSASDSDSARAPLRWLAAIVLLAAALRLFPIWFGLPYPQARPDEETAIGHAIDVLRGDPNPHFFHWPSLTFYVLAAIYWVASLVHPPLRTSPEVSGEALVLIARGFVALCGTVTVVVLYRIGRRIAGESIGLIAALLLAVSVLHVRESHFAMTDVLMTLLVTTSLALLLRALDGAAARSFLLAGIAGGLAASTKYSAAAVLAAAAVVQLQLVVTARRQRWNLRAWLPGALFVAAFTAAFLAGTPFALLDYPKFREDLLFDFTHLSGGHAGVDLGRGWTYHATRSLPFGAGLTIYLAGLAGILPMARQYGWRALSLAGFFAGFYAALGSGTTVFFRYVLPLIPLVCLSAAVFAREASRWLSARSGLSATAASAVVLTITAGPVLSQSAWMDAVLARRDTRVLALDWLKEHVRPEDTLHDGGGNYTRLQLDTVRVHDWRYDPATSAFPGAAGRVPDWLVLPQSPLRAYTWAPASLRTLAATRYHLVHTVRGARHESAARGLRALVGPVYDLQDAFFLPVSGFHTVDRPGPTILIYRRADLPPVR